MGLADEAKTRSLTLCANVQYVQYTCIRDLCRNISTKALLLKCKKFSATGIGCLVKTTLEAFEILNDG